MKRIKTNWRYLVGAALAMASCTTVLAQSPILVDQGTNWTATTRASFYTQDQGSQLIPLKWYFALKRTDGTPFAANSLDRYGYLANPTSPVAGLPVGFTTNLDKSGEVYVGPTCSGCHTRQITVAGQAYRIDGGPAITDFGALLADLDAAATRLLNTSTVFDQFAIDVLGSNNNATTKAALRSSVQAWYTPFHTIISGSLPTSTGIKWGAGRLDAVSMIFNRISGLDVGLTAPYIIAENIRRADAPTRYPFLWNASKQDRTQWLGFADNGSPQLALARNLGEVEGVFGKLHPIKSTTTPPTWDYLTINSTNFPGLGKQESNIVKLGPPKWPFALNATLVAAGKTVFYKKDTLRGNVSCDDCHGIKAGIPRVMGSTTYSTWATPVQDVGTDSRQANLTSLTVKTGVMEGAIKPDGTPMKAIDSVVSLLQTVSRGVIKQYLTSNPFPTLTKSTDGNSVTSGSVASNGPNERDIEQLGRKQAAAPAALASYAYESRVLQGIWAAAPYLHNGSVPTLADLLKPVLLRPVSFRVGPAYDTTKVGLAATQTKLNHYYLTTDCLLRNSGNSRCGHEYGTNFTATEKTALLEYLKQL
jgi:hypothetical protein